MDKVSAFIAHYASEYYDPVKAREYYLRTRELKGRQLSTKAEKEAWNYTNANIGAAEKKDLTTAAEAQKAALEQIKATATARQEEIRAKIKSILENLTNDKKAQIEQITKDVADQIAALPEIPKNISKNARAKLVEKRQEEIDKIRGDAKTKIQGVSSGAQAKKNSEIASSRSSTEQVKLDVKASVESARGKYQELRQALKDKYDTVRQQELQAIKANV